MSDLQENPPVPHGPLRRWSLQGPVVLSHRYEGYSDTHSAVSSETLVDDESIGESNPETNPLLSPLPSLETLSHTSSESSSEISSGISDSYPFPPHYYPYPLDYYPYPSDSLEPWRFQRPAYNGYPSIFPFNLSSYSSEPRPTVNMTDPQAFLTYIVDADSLVQAVDANPQRIFDAFVAMGVEREDIRKQRDAAVIERDQARDNHNALLARLDGIRGELSNARDQLEHANHRFEASNALWQDQRQAYNELLKVKSQQTVCLLLAIERLRLVIFKGGLDPDSCNHIPSKLPPPPEYIDPYVEMEHARAARHAGKASQTKLDPNAEAFKPVTATASVASSSTGPVQPAASPGSIPEYMLRHIVSTLPEGFKSICPVSICSGGPCIVQGCMLAKLCPAYNDETSSAGCTAGDCQLVHKYHTCEKHLDGAKSRCAFFEAYRAGNKGPVVKNELKERLDHVRKRAHKGDCDAEEWEAREILAGLRDAHLEGRLMDYLSAAWVAGDG